MASSRPSSAASASSPRPSARRCEPSSPRCRRCRGRPQQLQLSNEARRVLTDAHAVSERMHDEYVSTEHLLLAAIEAGDSAAARVLRDAGVEPASVLEALSQIRGSQRVTSENPEATYEALEKYGRDLTEARAQGQARPGHRPRRGDPPRHPDPVAPDEEQPGADRRAGRRQDRDRRGPRPAHRARRRARGPEGPARLLARHGRAGRRREVPRRVRGAPQGGAQGGQPTPRAASSSSSTSCTPSSAPARPRARWTPATC